MTAHGDDSGHRPRPHDHLVEPMYAGLGLEQESGDGIEEEAGGAAAGYPKGAPTTEGVGSRLGALLGRLGRWWRRS